MTNSSRTAASLIEMPPPFLGTPAAQPQWDSRYADKEQMSSGRPNGASVPEVAGLTPGRVLDVGGSEGADALWLAMIVTLLDDDRVVKVNEQHPGSTLTSGTGAHHIDSAVLHARRGARS